MLLFSGDELSPTDYIGPSNLRLFMDMAEDFNMFIQRFDWEYWAGRRCMDKEEYLV